MQTDRRSLLDAVNAMVGAEDGAEMYSDLTALIPMAGRIGARFTGERAVLNALLELALADRAQFDRVVGLVELKRAQAGREPLVKQTERGYDKTDYMRDFMAQKRERERRAAKIENMIRPPSAKLAGRSRLDFMQAQSARWKPQRDAMLEEFKRKVGRKLRREEQRDVLKQFWERVDKELDDREELARAEATKPAYKRVK